MIFTLCLSDSVPPNYKEVLDNYTKEGYRVIAIATKEINGDQRNLRSSKEDSPGFSYRKA